MGIQCKFPMFRSCPLCHPLGHERPIVIARVLHTAKSLTPLQPRTYWTRRPRALLCGVPAQCRFQAHIVALSFRIRWINKLTIAVETTGGTTLLTIFFYPGHEGCCKRSWLSELLGIFIIYGGCLQNGFAQGAGAHRHPVSINGRCIPLGCPRRLLSSIPIPVFGAVGALRRGLHHHALCPGVLASSAPPL